MLSVGLLSLFACGDQASEPAAPAPAAAKPTPAPAPAEPAPITRRGKVVETVEAETYTYARLDYCGQEAWVAGPKSELPVGSIVKMPEGIVQQNFESKALGKTLDVLLLVDWFEVTDDKAIDCPTAHGGQAREPEEKPPPALHGKVVETMQSGGYTYALVDSCGTQQWAAGRQSFLKVGHFVQAAESATMPNFEAKSLGRTFETILFVPGFKIVAEGPECE